MNEQIKNENEKKNRAILAGIDTGEYDAEISMDELEELARTAGAEVICRLIQKRPTIESATILGEGKIAELSELAEMHEADLIVFDMELSSSQIRNIEDITNVRVIDRTMLILDIFAGRAVTNEGKLQVELAQLKYRLPRLMGIGTSLSRLGGGIGTRGPGETQLETDRRHIRRRIEKLSEELKELEKRREQSRRRRKKDSVIVGAIVGYTNAGKSTLLNALTDAGVLAENKLFATLDLTSRAIELPDGRSVTLVDTVGLIRRLPHHLVEAFKSTLEEAANADIILHVCDASDPEAKEKADTTLSILADLGCGEIPVINIFNKCDRLDYELPEDETNVCISAKHKQGFDKLLKAIAENLPDKISKLTLCIPYDKSALAAALHSHSKVISEEYAENGISVTALVDKLHISDYLPYVTE
ncbi:MAG: GTPase HflX [Ruminiclostridium sp.]|nr:GTPase HflX [Ruminiclostridium sp.]